jgi:hypothetical protein
MIRCRLAHLDARCRQRGYTLDEVRPCIVSEDGDAITVDETHPAYPRQARPVESAGDVVRLSLLDKAKNFAASAVQHIAAGLPATPAAEIDRRFAICQGCEFYDGTSCQKCGCPIVRESKFISKLAWADQSCPEGKWGPVATAAGNAQK